MTGNQIARALYTRREIFGYIYRKPDYNIYYGKTAPWATGDMTVSAPNLPAAILRDLSFCTPIHEGPCDV